MSNIITTTELSAYMNKTLNSAIAGQVVAAVNKWIETRTHRTWGVPVADLVDITERRDWARNIYLRNQDIVAVTSVKLGYPGGTQHTLTSDSYSWDEIGRISLFTGSQILLSPLNGRDYVEVTYTHGVAEVPEDLKLAALGVAAGFYNYAVNNQGDVSSAQVGSYRLTYRQQTDGTKNPANNTNDFNWSIIDSYKLQRM